MVSPPITRIKASLGDSPPGIAALSAAPDALPIRLTNPNAVLNASPIDSTIEVKNVLTLSINIPGSSVNKNLTPSNNVLNAAIIGLIAPNTMLIIPSSNWPTPSFSKPKSSVKRPATILNIPLKAPIIPSTKSLNPPLIASPICSNPNSLKMPPIILPTIFTNPPIRPLNTPIIPSRTIPIIPSSLNPFIAPLIPPINPVIIEIAIPIGPASLANPVPRVNIFPAYAKRLAKNFPTIGRVFKNPPIAPAPLDNTLRTGAKNAPIFPNTRDIVLNRDNTAVI